jgi:hypothetical protein
MWMRVKVDLHPRGSRGCDWSTPGFGFGGGLWDRVVGVPGALLATRNHIFMSHLLKRLEIS